MADALEYGFDERLKMSQGHAVDANVESILLANIPAALSVNTAHTVNDKSGTDWWVEMRGGYHLSVDAKVREKDCIAAFGEDDLALETWSVVDKKVGWTRDEGKRTDYVLWLWKDTGRWCLIPFPMLCRVYSKKWADWKDTYKTRQQFTPSNFGGYRSECTFVPRREVWAEIYRQFGGDAGVPA